MSSVLRQLLLVSAVAACLTGGPVAARPGSRFSTAGQLRSATTFVTVIVPPSAYDRATGIAVISLPRAIRGEMYASRPWTLRARAASAFLENRGELAHKPCGDLAIRGSGQPSFQPLTTSGQPLLSGKETGDWVQVAFDLQLTSRLTDAGGRYGLQVLFDFN